MVTLRDELSAVINDLNIMDHLMHRIISDTALASKIKNRLFTLKLELRKDLEKLPIEAFNDPTRKTIYITRNNININQILRSKKSYV